MNRLFGKKLGVFFRTGEKFISSVLPVKKTIDMGSSVLKFISYKLRLRNRYLFTRHNNLRLRYVMALAIFIATGLFAMTVDPHHSNALGRIDISLANLAPASGTVDDVRDRLNGGRYGELSLASITGRTIPEPLELEPEVVIKSGDALGVVLEKEGIGRQEVSGVIKAMRALYSPRNIKVGQKVQMFFDEESETTRRFREMKIDINPIKTLVVARAGDEFKAAIDEKKVKKVIKAKQAEVKVSLYGSAANAGIPQGVVAEAIHIFSWAVDFQRDIRPQDTLEVMYESYETPSGYVAKNGNILYAKLTLSGREIPLYRFDMKDGRVGYFKPDGMSIKRTLMRTPINGARMSSGFGKRRHPVLGYTKMHKGVDFAAPTGTPIFAAGDGVVEKAGWFSSFGKYIRIRHNSKLKTAYAHMSKIKVKPGSRVTQGQVIGYVGTTGRSTGPHLHYEVISNGRQVNPRSVNLPIGEELMGKEKSRFTGLVRKVKTQFSETLEGTKVAQR